MDLMEFSLGFSPCPNDTFIFDALVNGKIDTGTFRFRPVLEDVETLNRWALEGRLDITKLSFSALFRVESAYSLLDTGAALGLGCGPLLIARSPIALERIPDCRIAIPGDLTTASLLLHYAFPGSLKTVPMLFSEIEDAILEGEVDAGAIIHENRFTYQDRGLVRILDLGEYWEQQTQTPIPLGGIVIRRNLDKPYRESVEDLIRKSLEYAEARYPELTEYMSSHSQAMAEEVMRRHIRLYVNQFTRSLGPVGHQAIRILREKTFIPQTLPLRDPALE